MFKLLTSKVTSWSESRIATSASCESCYPYPIKWVFTCPSYDYTFYALLVGTHEEIDLSKYEDEDDEYLDLLYYSISWVVWLSINRELSLIRSESISVITARASANQLK